MDWHRIAQENIEELRKNTYVGRGAIVGLDEKGWNIVQAGWTMGRSEPSRSRVYGQGEDGLVFTEPTDPAKIKDPSLVIYNAMREVQSANRTIAIVSNGHQTDAIALGYSVKHENMAASLVDYEYEPDENHTPRISAISYWRDDGVPVAQMSLLRKSPWSGACDRNLYELNDLGSGFGHCLTTYSGDGKPLPSFTGEPYLLPLQGKNPHEVANALWKVLNKDNRVSIAVKFIPKSGPSAVTIINQYSKVSVAA